jgi:hypothetical protein
MMISLSRAGWYKLIEARDSVKILYLDDEAFAWLKARGIGNILVASHNPHRLDALLNIGRYNLYDVQHEAALTDLQHLELEVGSEAWQGYLLPTGLPTDKRMRTRIIPTPQLITRDQPKKKGGHPHHTVFNSRLNS